MKKRSGKNCCGSSKSRPKHGQGQGLPPGSLKLYREELPPANPNRKQRLGLVAAERAAAKALSKELRRTNDRMRLGMIATVRTHQHATVEAGWTLIGMIDESQTLQRQRGTCRDSGAAKERGGDKAPAVLTEAGDPDAVPLVADNGGDRAVAGAGPLTAAAGDGSSVAGTEQPADPASAALEKDLAALVAERGLLVSRRIGRGWAISGRDEQRPPPGDWATWLVMGGRGSGKTRAGAEWVHGLALSAGPRTDLRIALIAETLGDAREVMIDGASGIARIARRMRPEVEISRRRLVWPNGAIAQIFSSEDPESLRGPQFHFAWCDDLGFMISYTDFWRRVRVKSEKISAETVA